MNILTLDRDITLAINGWHTPFGDTFFWHYTKVEVWIPVFLLLIILIWRENGIKAAAIFTLLAAIAILLADQTCNIIKLLVCRYRPTHEPMLQGLVHTVNGYQGGDYGFCSSHAANTTTLALFTTLLIRRWQYTLALATWVVGSCWSRIYLGVHYMGDILCGMILGGAIALLAYCLWHHIHMQGKSLKATNMFANLLVASYVATTLIITGYALASIQ